MATTEREQIEQRLSPEDPRVARPIFTLRETAGYLGVPKSTITSGRARRQTARR